MAVLLRYCWMLLLQAVYSAAAVPLLGLHCYCCCLHRPASPADSNKDGFT